MKRTGIASLDDLRAWKSAGDTRAPATPRAEIDLPDGFWDDAEVTVREPKKSVHLRVDADVLNFFKAQGKGHLTRMNAVLRSYVDAQRKDRNG